MRPANSRTALWASRFYCSTISTYCKDMFIWTLVPVALDEIRRLDNQCLLFHSVTILNKEKSDANLCWDVFGERNNCQ